MKKLVFAFAAIVAVSFASCGQKAQQAPVDEDTVAAVQDSIVEDTTAQDTAAQDTTAAAQAE